MLEGAGDVRPIRIRRVSWLCFSQTLKTVIARVLRYCNHFFVSSMQSYDTSVTGICTQCTYRFKTTIPFISPIPSFSMFIHFRGQVIEESTP